MNLKNLRLLGLVGCTIASVCTAQDAYPASTLRRSIMPGADAGSWGCGTVEGPFGPRSLVSGTPWPGGVVPIAYNAAVTSANRNLMAAALASISSQVHVTFVARTTQTNYITITNSTVAGVSSSSSIGMAGGQQTLSIASTHWVQPGTLVHEICHALGLRHEQARADRDQFIEINYAKIAPGHESQFDVQPGLMGDPYDLGSVMHYGPFGFSVDGDRTIRVKGTSQLYWQYLIGKASGLSPADGWALQRVYGGSPRPNYTMIISPAQGAVVAVGPAPQFSWTAADGASGYDFTLSSDAYFRVALYQTTTANTELTVPIVLSPHTTYFWRVTASNAAGSSPMYPLRTGMFYCSDQGYPGVLFVDDSAPAGGDGLSWATAYRDLSDAIFVAQSSVLGTPAGVSSVAEIRVGQGTYKPDSGTMDLLQSFHMYSGLQIKGGFAGVGTANPELRDFAAYSTILTGDLVGDDAPGFANRADNSNYVVEATGVDASAVLEGFTIRGGSADDVGAGVVSDTASTTVRDCIFSDNQAIFSGGAESGNYGGSPTFERCVFMNNRTTGATPNGIGGAVCPTFRTAATYTNCVFGANTARGGGAASALGGSASFRNCLFTGNSATGSGTNAGGGAANAVSAGAVSLVNCTVVNNTSLLPGSALSVGSGNVATVVNSVVWNNGATPISAAGTIAVSFSTIQGGYAGVSNSALDPLFAAPGQFSLSSASPARDAGSNAAVPGGLTTDLVGQIRIVGPTVDQGAYEFRCASDFNADGHGSVSDIFDYLSAWFARSPAADFDHDGTVAVADIFSFLSAWFAVC